MRKTLKPFQVTGAKFLASRFHALLADEPGLGKTLQILEAMELVNAKHKIVTCPASVRLNWFQEAEECFGHTRGLDVVSYNLAGQFVKAPSRSKYDAWGGDEIHFTKTVDSQRTRAIYGTGGIASMADYKWTASGTPWMNRPVEIYPTAQSLAGDKIAPYNSFKSFAQRFCGAYFDGRGLNVKGHSNLKDLAFRMSGGPDPFMLRRTKAEVLPELPKRIITRIPIEVSPAEMAAVYAEEENIVNREAFLSPTKEAFAQLGDMASLRRLVGLAKVSAVTAFAVDLLETVDKVVIFTWHRDVAAVISTKLGAEGIGSVTHIGGMTDLQKKAVMDRFKTDPNCRVFIGNMTSAGTGINGLQHAANDCIFAEIDWTPGTMSQSVDRLDRMDKVFPGPVNAYIPHVPGTIESAMLGSSDGKIRVIDVLVKSPESPAILLSPTRIMRLDDIL